MRKAYSDNSAQARCRRDPSACSIGVLRRRDPGKGQTRPLCAITKCSSTHRPCSPLWYSSRSAHKTSARVLSAAWTRLRCRCTSPRSHQQSAPALCHAAVSQLSAAQQRAGLQQTLYVSQPWRMAWHHRYRGALGSLNQFGIVMGIAFVCATTTTAPHHRNHHHTNVPPQPAPQQRPRGYTPSRHHTTT